MKRFRHRGARALAGAAAAAGLALSAHGQQPSFVKGTLQGATPTDPTSLAWGADGRLYVLERFGPIRAYTVQRNGPADYAATHTESLNHVYSKPNRRDDGSPEPSVVGRQATGILAAGTAEHPLLYVTSSDPRVAVGNDSGLDTNSGILTRLTWNGTAWEALDLVRGLPRCEENHASNGMALDPLTNTLYLAQGGNTNMGAPSNSFGGTPEYALSAAILTVDLDAIGDTTYDLPTLDDPTRPNVGPGGADEHDPFGGNDGANQAVIVPGGPVQVYAPGFRNPYDVVLHSSGRLYTIDNGPNVGWGGLPTACSNDPSEAGSAHYPDALHRFGTLGDGGGYYGGHPNPFRASSANTIAGQSPIPPGSGDPVECDYVGSTGGANGALTTWNSSTNGMCEYTASNFDGAMLGDLLTVTYTGNTVERIRLAPDGTLAGVSTLFSAVGSKPLDVAARGDADEWPGTIWVASFGTDRVVVYEPDDLTSCTGAYSLGLDEDGDGYSNADEADNGTNPCSAGDVPPDADGDFLSDRNDPDDDGDGVPDVVDAFALDPANGADTPVPFHYEWGLGDPGTGLFGLGFTGLQTNGSADYLDQFTPSDVIAGGAAGKVTLDHVGPGDALGSQNDQRAGFQLGVDASGAGPFTVRTAVEAPFFGGAPSPGQSHGLVVGTGTQDEYVEIALAAGDGTGAVQVVLEEGGVVLEDTSHPAAVLGSSSVELSLAIDPATGTVQPAYRADGGALVPVGGPRPLPAGVAAAAAGAQPLAVGIVATAGPTAPSYAATWDWLELVQDSTASADVSLGPAGAGLHASTFDTGAFRIANTSPDGQSIESVTIDLSTALLPDLVFDPSGAAGDTAFKGFTADGGAAATGLAGNVFSDEHDGGFDRLTLTFGDFEPGEVLTFSVDVDPTTIAGAAPPGPNESGSVSGLELAGSSVTVAFDDGAALLAHPFRAPASLSESVAEVRAGPPPAPAVELLGHAGDRVVVEGADQTLRITGPPGQDVRVLVAEAGLYLAGLAGGGFDVDPFEANALVGVQELAGTLDGEGVLDLPLVLGQSGAEAGLHHLTAAVLDAQGRTGAPAPVLVAELAPPALSAAPAPLAFGAAYPGTQKARTTTVSNAGPGLGTVLALELTGSAAFQLGAAPAVPLALPGGGSVDVEVVFAPAASGPAAGTLFVHHDGGGSPLAIALSGTGAPLDLDVLYRVNCGGPQLAAPDATAPWSADTGDTPSPWVNASETNSTAANGGGIPVSGVPASAPAALFGTERYDPAGGAEMRWAFPVPSAVRIEVRLYVAETWSGITGPGQRVFDVVAEGRTVPAIDAYAEAGFDAGYARSVVVDVADGTLDLAFEHGVENPAIKAIEVRRASSLVSSRPLISVAAGGTQELFLTAGATFGGDTYLVLSGVSGTSPGLPLGPIVLPLVFDTMTTYSLASANAGPYVDSLGVLDAAGRGEAAFVVPPDLPPALAGVAVSHAAVLFEGSAVLAASRAVTMTLTE